MARQWRKGWAGELAGVGWSSSDGITVSMRLKHGDKAIDGRLVTARLAEREALALAEALRRNAAQERERAVRP